MHWLDAGALACFVPLAWVLLVSGLDDLVVAAVWLGVLLRGDRNAPALDAAALRARPQKRLAIFVPLWHEHQVIGRMLEHNVAAIDYRHYDFFVGAYPNDEPTLDAVREAEARFSRVHLAVCAHDGPTSKADCLNWVYQRMLLYEEQHGVRFDAILTHDAEDLIHPQSLLVANAYLDRYDMVQVPVLALHTSLRQLVHGVYCDEFGEFQSKDMRVRAVMGSFTPSAGVGTAFSRVALERLAETESNRIFEPACLTEDYENGMRLHRLGYKHVFVPLQRQNGEATGRNWIATREFFPHDRKAAIGQRARWVTGIALQTWERHGWRGKPGEVYWFWRDRKGLVGNPASLLTNVLFFYGSATLLWSRVWHTPWALAGGLHAHAWLATATFGMGGVMMFIRMACVARLYGPVFALGVVPRVFCGNYINTLASRRALWRYALARWRHEPLRWVKTEHAYPSRNALLEHKRKLGEVLAAMGFVSHEEIDHALATQPRDVRLGEHLLALGKITEDDLYEALSMQQSVPAAPVEPHEVETAATRALPKRVVRTWKVLPYRIAAGSMFLASPEVPSDDLARELREFTRLELRFQLVTPANFEKLVGEVL